MSAASSDQQEPEVPDPTPVAVADLIVGGISTRARGIDPKWVKQLVATGADWPPILITRHGIVLDGQHRVLAAQELHRTHISARTFTGGETSAELLEAAAAGNAAHGMPLTWRSPGLTDSWGVGDHAALAVS